MEIPKVKNNTSLNTKSIPISVVIPAFNVENYIEKAILSALSQPEVMEVVLIDDGSTDNSLNIINEIAKSNDKVKVYQHKDGVNKGRGATRNLGIIKATSVYIAFLDADDFYLSNRFQKDLEVLHDPSIDGCYSAVGFHFYRKPKSEEAHHYKGSTLSRPVRPGQLFENIVTTKLGYLHLNGLTVKKSVFNEVGLMNENLRVTQDTDIIFKLAMKCKLMPASIKQEVALRGVHDTNVFYQDHLYKKYTPILFESLLSWSIRHHIKIEDKDHLMNALWIHRFRTSQSLVKDTFYWLGLQMRLPKLCLTILPIKYFPIIRKRKQLFSFLYR
jgi:glycosyltransferase involved in cell wall biosynthesis